MWFGAHEGRFVGEVIDNYPDYALWAHHNVYQFDLTDKQLNFCYGEIYKNLEFDIYGFCMEDYKAMYFDELARRKKDKRFPYNESAMKEQVNTKEEDGS